MTQLINILISLLASLTLVVATPPKTDYDVIIVGGGPAGLSAQSAMCRVSRTSILFDDARYRNEDTRHMHDVIGNDGKAPNDFRAAAREQIAKYQTGLYKTKRVEAIFYQNLKGYRIFYAFDSDGAQYTARRVILATGVKDDLPTYLQGPKLFGKGIFWCPWCDGFEHRGQPLAILGNLSRIVDDVLEMNHINPDIVLLASGSDTAEERTILDGKLPGWKELIQEAGVDIISEPVTGVSRLDDGSYEDLPARCRTENQAPILNSDPDEPNPEVRDFPDPKKLTGHPCTPFDEDAGPNGRHYDRFEITFDGHDPINRSAIMIETLKHQRSTLPSQLGLDVNDQDRVVISMKKVMSSVAGIHAVGDMTNEGATNVPWAMYSGKKAAVVVHVDIAREDAYDGNVPPSAPPAPGAPAPPPGLLKRGFDVEITERDAMEQVGNHMEKLWRRIEARRKK